MRKTEKRDRIAQTGRTVTALLSVENKNPLIRFRNRSLPRHTYIFCRSRNIANHFLADAEAEGFTFCDGKRPTSKRYSDIYAINQDLTISYTGWAGHMLFHNPGAGNAVRIDYGKYITGAMDYQM